jgi:hypothetical protein
MTLFSVSMSLISVVISIVIAELSFWYLVALGDRQSDEDLKELTDAAKRKKL